MSFDYYQAPAQEIFDAIKDGAITLWRTYDDSYGYASEKISRIKDIQNVRDNTGYIVAMFDHDNRLKLYNMVEGEAALYLGDLLAFSGDLPF